MSEGSFHRVISEHLALAERNRRLERAMPLDRYREQYGHVAAAEQSPPSAEDPSTDLNVAAPRHEAKSWWDTSDERPLPAEFDWGDA